VTPRPDGWPAYGPEAACAPDALRDALTGLATRDLFLDRVGHLLRRRAREEAAFTVLCLGIDQLDAVSDALGPLAADLMEMAAAHFVETTVRPGDTAARVASGCIAVLLEGVADAAAADAVAARIQAAMARPLHLGGHETFTTLSVGIAPATDLYGRADHVLRDAHAAMDRARAAGPGTRLVFQPAIHGQAMERLLLESELRRADPGREFGLLYQPIVCTETGRIAAFEALLRWHHPRRGVLEPGAFLAAAEETGTMVPIGRWCLAEACREAAGWPRPDGGGEAPGVNVNLSVHELRGPNVVAHVEEALALSGLAPNRLRLEITESALVEAGQDAVDTLCRLKSVGVQLCLDDFGVGFSCLAYLHRFPVDVLKVDRSFVAGLGLHPEHMGIVRAVTVLAHGLGMDVVAEGVETAEQLGHVRALECDFAQGWLFARALNAADARDLLAPGPGW
jgi:diguanylate cyclase (GGDEF)-like protein